jgi:hypothetical protein
MDKFTFKKSCFITVCKGLVKKLQSEQEEKKGQFLKEINIKTVFGQSAVCCLSKKGEFVKRANWEKLVELLSKSTQTTVEWVHDGTSTRFDGGAGGTISIKSSGEEFSFTILAPIREEMPEEEEEEADLDDCWLDSPQAEQQNAGLWIAQVFFFF